MKTTSGSVRLFLVSVALIIIGILLNWWNAVYRDYRIQQQNQQLIERVNKLEATTRKS